MALLNLWRNSIKAAHLMAVKDVSSSIGNCTRLLLTAGVAPHSKWNTPYPVTTFHTSSVSKGLEEFFPKTDDIIEEGEHAGRSWRASDLRQKSYEDLHKLWYVLLKERNMLLTLEKEANRLRYQIPAPERKHKVAKSMARLKYILHERALAIREAKKELGMIPREEEEENKKTKQARHRAKRRWKKEQRKKEEPTDGTVFEPESVST